MAKLNTSTDRLALVDDDEDLFLRPEAPQRPRKSTPANSRDADAFLRARRRVAPRKTGRLRALAGHRLGRILLAFSLLALFSLAGGAIWAVRSFLLHDPHFTLSRPDQIQTTGATELSRAALLQVFAPDRGHSIFSVPLSRRAAALEAQPWVRHATVMRILPDTLRIAVQERVPVAFVRIGRSIQLVDAAGVILHMAPATLAARHYSFPVVTGLNPQSPPAARAARMQLFERFIAALDSGNIHRSSQLSEVNLADLDDLQAIVPAQGTDLLLHFGNTDFLERYRSYQQHLADWRRQYPNLSAVDLRYDRQVVLKMAPAPAAPAQTPPHRAAAPHHTNHSAATKTAHKAAHKSTHHPAKHPKRHPRHPWVAHFIPHAGRSN